MRNIGTAAYGGALTAGLFLKEFAGDVPWAHLDIAGPPRASSDDGYSRKGGTGFGVRTLVELLTHSSGRRPRRPARARPPRRRRAPRRRKELRSPPRGRPSRRPAGRRRRPGRRPRGPGRAPPGRRHGKADLLGRLSCPGPGSLTRHTSRIRRRPAWRCARRRPPPTSRPRPPRARSTSTSGWATAGACCSPPEGLHAGLHHRARATSAKLKPEFDKRNVKVIGLSVDPVESHEKWAGDIEETQGTPLNFPMIADPDRKVADLYDMIHPNANDTLTVRSVFVIGPDKKVKLTHHLPGVAPAATSTRSSASSTRCSSRPSTRSPRRPTGRTARTSSSSRAVSDEEAKEMFPEGWNDGQALPAPREGPERQEERQEVGVHAPSERRRSPGDRRLFFPPAPGSS